MSRRLLILNGLAVLMVVVHHSAGYGLNALFEWTDRYLNVEVPNYDQLGSIAYYILLLIRQIVAFAIPAFLFISGYFIVFTARTDQKGSIWESVIPRIKKLIVPFIIWTVLVVILLQRFPPSWRTIIRLYYYIPLIAQFYVLSPLLIPLAKYHWVWLLIVSAIIQFGLQALRHFKAIGIDFPGLDMLIALSPIWFFPWRMFFFSLGLVSGIHYEKFNPWLAKNKWILFFVMILFLVLGVPEQEFITRLAGKEWLGTPFATLSRDFFAVAFLLCFLAFRKVSIPFTNQFSYLGANSMGIYLVHIPALYVIASVLYFKTPWILGQPLLYQIILISFGFALPLIAFSIILKSPFRKYYHYIFG